MRQLVCYAAIFASIALVNGAARADGGETGASPSHTQAYGGYHGRYYSRYFPDYPGDYRPYYRGGYGYYHY